MLNRLTVSLPNLLKNQPSADCLTIKNQYWPTDGSGNIFFVAGTPVCAPTKNSALLYFKRLKTGLQPHLVLLKEIRIKRPSKYATGITKNRE